MGRKARSHSALSTLNEAHSGGAVGLTLAALIYPAYGYRAVMLSLLTLSLFGCLLAAWRSR